MKKILLSVVLAVTTLALSTAAEARSHKKKNHYSARYHRVVHAHHRAYQALYLPQSRALRDPTNPRSFQREATLVAKGNTNLIRKAEGYIGANAHQLGLPSSLWCADFMNMLVGGADRRAISFTHRGAPAPAGCVNCVAVTRRRGGYHVGVVAGYDGNGNPILISGNHGRRVGVGTYSRGKVIAFRYV